MKLSIITINYNNRDGLQRTYDSVVCQTFTDYEWIVIDGGSTDGSREFIEQHQDKFAYWCSEPDKGVYNAMNKGIAKAQGEYLIFMNSGDVFHERDILSKIEFNNYDSDIISGLTQRMDNNEILICHEDDLVMQLLWISLNHQGTFIKREVFDSFQYDEHYKIVSDWKFWWDAIVFGKKSFERIDLIIADVEIGGLSTNPLYDDLKIGERKDVLNSLFPPLLLKTLYDYQTIRNQKPNQNTVRLEYLKDNHYLVYIIVRKCTSLFYRLCKKIYKD